MKNDLEVYIQIFRKLRGQHKIDYMSSGIGCNQIIILYLNFIKPIQFKIK